MRSERPPPQIPSAAQTEARLDARVAEVGRWLLPLFTFAIFVLVAFLIHRELAQFRLRDVIARLRDISADAVLRAATLTALSYWLLGFYDVLALRYVMKSIAYARVAFTSFIASSIGHNLGLAAFTGAAIRYRLYSSAGLTAADVATVQGFCSLTTGLGLAVLAGVSLLLEPVPASAALHIYPLWGMALGSALLLFVCGYAAWGSLGRGILEVRGWSLRPPGATVALPQVLLGVVDLSLSGAVLWMLLPPTAHVPFVTFAGAYAIAVTAGIVSHVPGGLGVFESVILLTFRSLPADELLGSLLAYRMVYYIVPLFVAAFVFAAKEVAEQRSRLARVERIASAYIEPLVPQVSGTLVFLAGCVLLVSGGTPVVDSRLIMLRHVLPLAVLELSHLIGSIVGLGLLILARALFRRVRAGYQLTVWLLIAGMLASLLKGLDFEEAIVLAVVFVVLWLGRRAFYRPASILEERFTPAWIGSIIAVIGAAIWIGFLAHRHVEYSHDMWWTFAMAADAPRTLRASLVVVLLAATILAMNLLRPARPEPTAPTEADLARARRAIAYSDVTIANVALAGDKRLLFAEPRAHDPDAARDAFIMYQIVGRSWVALGDPVGPRESHEDLVWRFRELSDRHGGWTVFYQVSGDRLPLYVDLGLAPIKIGEEARVDLAQFTLDGAARADLRQAHRRAVRDGATFEVLPRESVPRFLPTLQKISDAWLEDKATAEKGFSVGAFSERYISEFPVALVRAEGSAVAFANLWTTDTRDELSVDLMRFGDDAPRGAMDYLFIELMLWGQAQGYRWFNLGMAPLGGLERHPLAPAWHRVGNFVFRHGEHFYNFDGLRRYKTKFDPVWEP
ncbi:MAG TPA: bifunctional lysylphosphatidylglycerol flippase/synthetase MprF, partial [Steroidobacteraceae bacterium]